jgi:hypothetical protein
MQIKERLLTTFRGHKRVDVKGSVTNLSVKEDSDTSNILKFYIVPAG